MLKRYFVALSTSTYRVEDKIALIIIISLELSVLARPPAQLSNSLRPKTHVSYHVEEIKVSLLYIYRNCLMLCVDLTG